MAFTPDEKAFNQLNLSFGVRPALLKNKFERLSQVSVAAKEYCLKNKKNFIQFFGGRNFGTVPAMVLRQADDYAELKAAYRRCKAENKPPVIKSPFDGKEIDLTPFSRDGEPPEEEKLKIRNILARYREGIKIPDSFRENSREIAEASGLSGASQEKPLQAIGTRIRAEILSGEQEFGKLEKFMTTFLDGFFA